MGLANIEVWAAHPQRGQFGIIVRLSWSNQTMADMKSKVDPIVKTIFCPQ
jgi:hypothetical protein